MNIIEEFKKIFSIRDEVKQLSKDAQRYLLYYLFVDGTIDFVTASQLYVKSLEEKNRDKDNMMIEAETIILEDMLDRQPGQRKAKSHMNWLQNHIQRALYFLNMGKRTNMTELNKTFNYNEEKAKDLSWYENNKNYDVNGGYNYGTYK